MLNSDLLTSSGSNPPGIRVPSFEQKQYGRSHSAGLHFFARSVGGSVIGAGAKGLNLFISYLIILNEEDTQLTAGNRAASRFVFKRAKFAYVVEVQP